MGPGSVPGPELKRDRDRYQSLGPEMTGTGTSLRDQKWPGPGPELVPVPVPRRSLLPILVLALYFNVNSCVSTPCICANTGVNILYVSTLYMLGYLFHCEKINTMKFRVFIIFNAINALTDIRPAPRFHRPKRFHAGGSILVSAHYVNVNTCASTPYICANTGVSIFVCVNTSVSTQYMCQCWCHLLTLPHYDWHPWEM